MPEVTQKLNTRLMPFLVGGLILIQLLEPFRGWQILLVGLGGAWLLGYLWARSLARNLWLMREIRFGWAQVGDRLTERFTLENRGRIRALWVEIVDHSTLPGYQPSRVVSIVGNRSIRWFREAVCTHRGLFRLGPIRMRTGDPFGLYTVDLEYPLSIPLLVMPPILPLPTIEVAAGGRPGEGRVKTDALERTVSVSHVREYQSDDQWRWIHWPTSARHQSLYVRTFDGAPAGDWWVVLDMHREAHVGIGQNSTEEHEVILAASLADRGIRSGRAVGLVAANEDLIWLPPQGGEGQRWQILYSLAQVDLGDRPLGDLLTRMGSSLGRNTSLVIITPSVDRGWIQALVPLIDRGVIPTVLLLNPQSFGGSSEPIEVQSSLINLGVTYYLVSRDLLEDATARFDQMGKMSGIHEPSREPWEVVL
ncbi:MAG: DUF58 domain-containing protein [Anaerolineaceae bacterium]|nr:MAG: DUF58 domain-containing protein [Anaerolineaceae bacterium]